MAGRPDLILVFHQTYYISPASDFGVTSVEACLLEQTDWKFKIYTNLLQNKENKFQQHLTVKNIIKKTNTKKPQSQPNQNFISYQTE